MTDAPTDWFRCRCGDGCQERGVILFRNEAAGTVTVRCLFQYGSDVGVGSAEELYDYQVRPYRPTDEEKLQYIKAIMLERTRQ